MVQVFFATNRAADATKPNGFGADIIPYDQGQIVYAIADVTVDTATGTGTVDAISERRTGGFSDAALAAIVDSNRNLFVFVHGFDNTFEDSLTRAALNAEWYREANLPGADTTVIAFSWPSLGELIEVGMWPLDDAYLRDQAMATDSGFHLEYFLAEIDRVRQACQAKDATRRAFLLAHSMGNWVLQAAITRWYQANQPADDMFDEVILAAADEQADTFDQPSGSRLGHLRDVARRISIYTSRHDAMLWLSSAVNDNSRLGYDGPYDEADTNRFPAALFRFVDCTAVRDYQFPVLSEQSHQYYRLSPTVRNDIAAVMARTAQPAGGPTKLP